MGLLRLEHEGGLPSEIHKHDVDKQVRGLENYHEAAESRDRRLIRNRIARNTIRMSELRLL